MQNPSSSVPSAMDLLQKYVFDPIQNFFASQIKKIQDLATQFSEKTALLTPIFQHIFSYIYQREPTTFLLKKNHQKGNESLNGKFEGLVMSRKIKEAADLFMQGQNSQEIKSFTFNSFIDKLAEASFISQFTDVLTFTIENKLSLLSKYIMKKYYNMLAKANKTIVGQTILHCYTKSLQEDDSREILYRIYQYYISACIRTNEIATAQTLFSGFKNDYIAGEAHSPVYYKIYENLIKGLIGNDRTNSDQAKVLLEEIASQKPKDVFFNKLIDFSAKHNDLNFSEYIFKVMVSNTIQPSIVTYNTLIDSYFKQNKGNQAWILFELLKKADKKPDNFTYTTMINGIKSMDRPDLNKAFMLFNEYKEVNKPDQIIYNCLLDACINANNIDKAYQLLEEMKKDSTLKLDEICFNTLIKGCCKAKKLNRAIEFYEEMKKLGIKPNRITFNSLIDTCVKCGKMTDAWKYYQEMSHFEITADNFTYSILINGIKSNHQNKDELNKALSLFEVIQNKPDFVCDEIFYNSLIDACVKFGEVNRGLALFEEMKKKRIEPSSVTYGILIKAFGKINDLVKAFKIFEQMKLKHLKINDVTYGCLLDACVKNDRMDLALVLVEKMKQDNITLNTILYTTLIKGFSKANKLDDALKIFNLMKEDQRTQPNLITYNCILDACVKGENMNQALDIFQEMRGKNNFTPDLITYSTMIKGFCKQKNIEKAYQFLNLILDSKITPDEALINLLMECCYTTNQTDRAVEIFNIMINLKIPASNITYSILIKVYGKARKINKAMGVLDIMKKNQLKPSLITYTNLIQTCFKAKKVDYVVEVLRQMETQNFRFDHIFYSKVISGFLQFKKVELAYKYMKQAVDERINIGGDLLPNVIQALQESSLFDKSEMIQNLQKPLRSNTKPKFQEQTIKENNMVLNKHPVQKGQSPLQSPMQQIISPQRQNIQNVIPVSSEGFKGAEESPANSGYKAKFFNKKKDNKENHTDITPFSAFEEKKNNEIENDIIVIKEESPVVKEYNKENSQNKTSTKQLRKDPSINNEMIMPISSQQFGAKLR